MDPFKSSNMVLMKPPKVKDKSAAPIQITAEQILRDSQDHKHQAVKAPSQRIMGEEELQDYKMKKRMDFENNLRRQKHHIYTWIKYAVWEESLQEFRRARSIFERAIDIDYKHISLWLKYAEMEMRHKFINHARNVWERACTYLPRVDQFWYKYSYMEEMLGNYNRARAIFEKWMTWNPPESAWMAYFKFEQRMSEFENCRKIMYRYLEAFPKLETYLKVARYEEKNRNREAARQIYQKALEDLGDVGMKEAYFLNFARFETKCKEIERAREIYRYGLENIPKEKAYKLYDAYVMFEKQHGTKDEIDDLILNKRRLLYREKVNNNPLNYDAWFDLTNLELSTGSFDRVRETFKEAVKNTPPAQEKRFWRRYIYLWINYAVFEELDVGNIENANAVYEQILDLIPHQTFTFSKIWIMYAHFQLRCKNLEKVRKIFGNAIGKCPREKIFNAYVELELQLANIDRCRKIYEKFIEVFPDKPNAWIKYAELEKSLEEVDRSRAIYELGINQSFMDMPETLWKAYIDMEISLEEYDRVRDLYQRLLEKSKHVKVWISLAQFEFQIGEIEKARKVLEEANSYFKQNPNLKEERVILLETWRDIEKEKGDEESLQKVVSKLPKKVIKQRRIKISDGETEEEAGWEEYYDYIFPDDEAGNRNMKLLQKARLWKEGAKKTE